MTGASLPPADAGRIQQHIDEFASLTEPGAGAGVTRLAYTPLERAAHRRFAEYLESLGLECHVDAAGNTIGRLAGTDPSLPALGTGSHLDSVPNGGRFDGIAGVVAALEVARILVESGTRTRHPINFVAFATEEGARVGLACVGSRIVSGLTVRDDLFELKDRDGISVGKAMRDVGLDPDRAHEARWTSADVAAFLELHIEQGAVLASAGIPIGIVNVISGSTRIAIDLTGTASHTGGTPMHLRADALAAAAAMVLTAESLANDSRHHGTRMTVGELEVSPGSITTIPGHCRLYVDVRDVDTDRQRNATNELIAAAYATAEARGVGIAVELLGDTSPVTLPLSVQSALVGAAENLGLDYRVLASGASHDTQMINRICPGGMIFVPSRNDGVSHAPEELTHAVDIMRGVDLLAHSLLALDEASQEGSLR